MLIIHRTSKSNRFSTKKQNKHCMKKKHFKRFIENFIKSNNFFIVQIVSHSQNRHKRFVRKFRFQNANEN